MRRLACFLVILNAGCAGLREASFARQHAEQIVIHALTSPSAGERMAATRIAADSADPALDPPLAERLGDGDAAVRATAAAALARAATAAAGVLARSLDGDDAVARAIAIDAIRALPDWRARLTHLAADGDVRVRARVATAIGQLRPPDARALLSSLLRDADAGVRGQALYGLAALGSSDALDDVARALDDADLGVRLAALGALVRLGQDHVAPRLLALSAGSDRYLAARAAVQLSRAGRRAPALAAVAEAARDRNPAVRRAALNAAGELGDDGIALAVRALADPDADVRLDAARACLALQRAAAARPVLSSLLADRAHQLDAAGELARLGDAEGLSTLRALSHAADARLRARALTRLFALAAGRDRLNAALDDEDGEIRLAAAALVLQRAYRDPR